MGRCLGPSSRWVGASHDHLLLVCRYLFNDAEVKSFDSAQLASECFGGEMTVRAGSTFHYYFFPPATSCLADLPFFFPNLLQTKTYDSVTDKFMDFSFEKVRWALLGLVGPSVC